MPRWSTWVASTLTKVTTLAADDALAIATNTPEAKAIERDDLVSDIAPDIAIEIGTATTGADGLMSSTDKTKLDALPFNFIQSAVPVSPLTGAVWYQTDTGHSAIYNGTSWLALTPATGNFAVLISDAELWFDAADASTITESGGDVSQWNDKSKHQRNATQATGAQQPGTGSDTINSLNALTLGATSNLNFTSFNMTTGTWAWVANVTEPSTAVMRLFSNSTTTQTNRIVYSQTTNSYPDMSTSFNLTGTGNTVGIDTPDFAYGSDQQFIVTYNGGARLTLGNYTVSVNNVGKTVIGNIVGTGLSPVGNLGEIGGVTAGVTAKLGEWILFSRVLSAGEITTLDAYLNKWGT